MLSDKIGRTTTMILTIVMYSVFSFITAFAYEGWQFITLRFLVAMGIGGEWAVASSMVAEVFPARARAWSGSIFHASSVLGTLLATAAGAFVLPAFGWRALFILGAVPALLTVWIRLSLREPDKWVAAREEARQGVARPTGNLLELFQGRLLLHTAVGVSLAAIGLATFWAVHIYGKDFTRAYAEARALELNTTGAIASDVVAAAIKRMEMLGMFLTTLGGGLGLLLFGSISQRLGRRGAFALYHVAAFVIAVALFQLAPDASLLVVCLALPIFGFFTLGMHAGYAVYFPELYPTRVRGTGAGFCFNVGRIIAAPILIVKGLLLTEWGFTPSGAATAISFLYGLALIVLYFAPETRGKPLPE